MTQPNLLSLAFPERFCAQFARSHHLQLRLPANWRVGTPMPDGAPINIQGARQFFARAKVFYGFAGSHFLYLKEACA